MPFQKIFLADGIAFITIWEEVHQFNSMLIIASITKPPAINILNRQH